MYSLLETLVSDSLFQYPLLYAGYSITDSCVIYGVLLVPFANSTARALGGNICWLAEGSRNGNTFPSYNCLKTKGFGGGKKGIALAQRSLSSALLPLETAALKSIRCWGGVFFDEICRDWIKNIYDGNNKILGLLHLASHIPCKMDFNEQTGKQRTDSDTCNAITGNVNQQSQHL